MLNDRARRDELLRRIGAKTEDGAWKEEILDVAAEMLPLASWEVQHLKHDWLAAYGGWWPREQPVDVVLRLGLIQAIGLAGRAAPPARIDTYWVCGVEHVEVVSCVSPGQVTVLIFTPDAPLSDRLRADFAGATQREEIYTVRHRSRGPGEVQVQSDEESCEFVQPLVPRRH